MNLDKDEVVRGMNRAAKGIYIAVEEIVADDISNTQSSRLNYEKFN